MNLYIIDRNLFFRQSLTLALSNFKECNISGSLDHLADCLDPMMSFQKVDILLFDLDQEIYQLGLVEQIRSQNQHLHFLAYCGEVSRSRYLRLIQLNVRACVLKSEGLDVLYRSLIRVMEGHVVFPDQVVRQNIIWSDQPHHYFEDDLTEREIEILQYLTEGFSSKEVAQKLHLSYDTIKWHRNNMLMKTGSKNLMGLYKYAIHRNWVKLP